MKRHDVSPADILRLLKQPVGATRTAVRAADYMDNAVNIMRRSLQRREKRSINATGAHPQQVLSIFHTSSFALHPTFLTPVDKI